MKAKITSKDGHTETYEVGKYMILAEADNNGC